MNQVDHPPHYQSAANETRHILNRLGISSEEFEKECIDAIERNGFGFHVGNAVKYLWRAGQKGDFDQDLRKAKWYLERCLDYCNPGNRSQLSEIIVLINRLIE